MFWCRDKHKMFEIMKRNRTTIQENQQKICKLKFDLDYFEKLQNNPKVCNKKSVTTKTKEQQLEDENQQLKRAIKQLREEINAVKKLHDALDYEKNLFYKTAQEIIQLQDQKQDN